MRVSLLSHVLIIAGGIIIFHLYGTSSYYIRRASPTRNITPRRSMYSHQNEYTPNDYYAERPYYTGGSSNYLPYNNMQGMPGYNQGYNQPYWNNFQLPYANNFYPGNFIPWAPPPTILIIKAESCLPPEQSERPASSHGTSEEVVEENEEPMIPSTSAVIPEASTPVQNSTIPGSQLNVSSSATEEKSTARKRSALDIYPNPSKTTRGLGHLTQIARAAAALSHPQRRAMQFSFVDGKLSLNNEDESVADLGRGTSYVVVDLGRNMKDEN